MEQIGQSLWEEYLHVAFDPAHVFAELTFTLIFDFIFVATLFPLIKRTLSRFRKSLHAEIDREHGIEPHD